VERKSKMTITLKSGHIAYDPRLTRIPVFDEKSRQYPIRTAISETKPRSYTWSCGKHLDQGSEGSCVGHGFAHELIARPSVVDGIDSNFAVQKIYWEAQKIDQWAGGSYPGARPQYEGTSVLAGAKVVQKLGYVKEYRWAFGLDDLIMAVGYKGPAVIGVNWYQDMRDTDADGYISPTGDFLGGHCVLVKGVNVRDEYFTIHNSWGEDWGFKGDCKITFSDMHYLLNQDGEACIPLSRSNKKGLLQNILDAWISILG
jgi:hypothetical protein